MQDVTISFSFLQEQITTIALLGLLATIVATILTPIYTKAAYKYEFWKKQRDTALSGEKATIFHRLHAAKHAKHIPTMAGVIAVISVTLVTVVFNWDRAQTWLPVIAMLGAAVIGLVDDIYNLQGKGKTLGLHARVKFGLIFLIGLAGGLYSFLKLGYSTLDIPFVTANIEVGWLFVPIFILVILASANSVNMTDGLDGLAGGLLTIVFSAYTIIAFLQGNYGIAGFCATVAGALISYTWFNIYPARFFMGDVGSFAFGTALGVVAMLTDTVLLLPVIGLLFVVEAGSVIIQLTSKRLLKKKVFISTPFHHHFEAIGWPETKVTMRFWLVGQVAAVIGVIIAIYGGQL
jgi:phospho-N-acetylmuramoyl-pentapeptide-transferase